jgi:hypothetical protein
MASFDIIFLNEPKKETFTSFNNKSFFLIYTQI